MHWHKQDSERKGNSPDARCARRNGRLVAAIAQCLLVGFVSGCGGSNDGVDLVLRAQCVNGVQSSCQALGLPPQDTTVYGAGSGAATSSATTAAAAMAPVATAPTK